MHLHQPSQPLSIGKPTPNNSVYVLDKHHVPVGVGEAGIMWAGGCGVSRGYVGLPDKTAEKYRVDPFKNNKYVSSVPVSDECVLTAYSSTMYNTGDLCRWTPHGSIEILGRVDDQVKVKVSNQMEYLGPRTNSRRAFELS